MKLASQLTGCLAAILFIPWCLAQPEFTMSRINVQIGQPFTLTWSGSEGVVTITLKTGPSGNLRDVFVIASTFIMEDYYPDSY